jgi:hypothetical protein
VKLKLENDLLKNLVKSLQIRLYDMKEYKINSSININNCPTNESDWRQNMLINQGVSNRENSLNRYGNYDNFLHRENERKIGQEQNILNSYQLRNNDFEKFSDDLIKMMLDLNPDNQMKEN